MSKVEPTETGIVVEHLHCTHGVGNVSDIHCLVHSTSSLFLGYRVGDFFYYFVFILVEQRGEEVGAPVRLMMLVNTFEQILDSCERALTRIHFWQESAFR